MGVVTVSSSASQTPFSLNARFSKLQFPPRRLKILSFKTDKEKGQVRISPQDSISSSIDPPKGKTKCLRRVSKQSKRVNAIATDVSSCTGDLDYLEVAASLEHIYKLSPSDISDGEDSGNVVKIQDWEKKICAGDEKIELVKDNIVSNNRRKVKRLCLEKRITLKKKKEEVILNRGQREEYEEAGGREIDRLVKEYITSTDLVSLDWKKIKVPPVLPSCEHTWLFKLMQPMKLLNRTAENLQKDLGREATENELAMAVSMSVRQLRRHMDVGRAARNKLIKHNLRLVLFALNKYYQEFATGPKFQDLCQAGVKGLIIAIDRFEPKHGFRLSTYSLFWIRHAIMRSMTLARFTRVPFGLESVRAEIQKAKLELLFQLERLPTHEEIIAKVGISAQKYNDVMRTSKKVLSLNAKHAITQEEFIKGITDSGGVRGDNRKKSALLRLALDDVLDSLKPKESMVIRQRYGLDGKGYRTLGEVAGNLNISREVVRKHEIKAFMKLKHPTRVDYIRRYIV